MGQRVSSYLLTQLAINSSFGLLVAVVLALIDLPYAFLWGFLATLLIFVPVIGFWIAAALPTVLSLAVFTSWAWPLFVLGLFLIVKTIINTVLEPLLYSKSAGVLQVPLLILLAFWTWLWGPIGLILATPLTVSLLVFAKHVPELAFLNLLMSDQPAIRVIGLPKVLVRPICSLIISTALSSVQSCDFPAPAGLDCDNVGPQMASRSTRMSADFLLLCHM